MLHRMIMWPLPGVPGTTLSQQLREVSARAQSIAGRSDDGPEQLVQGYLRWATDAHRLLRRAMREQDIDRYVLTDRYWAILANTGNPKLLSEILLDEITYVANTLEELSRTFDQELSAWTKGHEGGSEVPPGP